MLFQFAKRIRDIFTRKLFSFCIIFLISLSALSRDNTHTRTHACARSRVHTLEFTTGRPIPINTRECHTLLINARMRKLIEPRYQCAHCHSKYQGFHCELDGFFIEKAQFHRCTSPPQSCEV